MEVVRSIKIVVEDSQQAIFFLQKTHIYAIISLHTDMYVTRGACRGRIAKAILFSCR